MNWVFHVVEVKNGSDGFVIKMRDGRHLRCVHNNPQCGHLPDNAPHPAIVLKMEDGTGLLLPIIVCMFAVILDSFEWIAFDYLKYFEDYFLPCQFEVMIYI